jgi:hypothetical protein
MPQSAVRLSPDGAATIWRAGRGMVVQEKNGFLVAVAFDHQRGDDQIGFRVEIENRSAARVDVDYRAVSYVTCTTPTTCGTRYGVVDPERVLIDMDLASSRERAAKTNDEIANGGLAMLGVLGAVASVASHNAQGIGASANLAINAAAQVSVDDAAHEQGIVLIDSARRDWQASALRRTTLFPSEGVGGDVFLPIDRSAALVWVRVDVGPSKFWFRFRQTVYGAEASDSAPVGHNR